MKTGIRYALIGVSATVTIGLAVAVGVLYDKYHEALADFEKEHNYVERILTAAEKSKQEKEDCENNPLRTRLENVEESTYSITDRVSSAQQTVTQTKEKLEKIEGVASSTLEAVRHSMTLLTEKEIKDIKGLIEVYQYFRNGESERALPYLERQLKGARFYLNHLLEKYELNDGTAQEVRELSDSVSGLLER